MCRETLLHSAAGAVGPRGVATEARCAALQSISTMSCYCLPESEAKPGLLSVLPKKLWASEAAHSEVALPTTASS